MISATEMKSLYASPVKSTYEEKRTALEAEIVNFNIGISKANANIRLLELEEYFKDISEGRENCITGTVVVGVTQSGWVREVEHLAVVSVMGECQKDKSIRRCPAAESFPEISPWRYMIPVLAELGYQLSFERTVSSLDERGVDLYQLVAYWD